MKRLLADYGVRGYRITEQADYDVYRDYPTYNKSVGYHSKATWSEILGTMIKSAHTFRIQESGPTGIKASDAYANLLRHISARAQVVIAAQYAKWDFPAARGGPAYFASEHWSIEYDVHKKRDVIRVRTNANEAIMHASNPVTAGSYGYGCFVASGMVMLSGIARAMEYQPDGISKFVTVHGLTAVQNPDEPDDQ